MTKEKKRQAKIIHCKIIDGNEEEIGMLAVAMNSLKKDLPFDVEFLVSNQRIELTDIKGLIKQLYDLHKKQERGQKDDKKKNRIS